MKWPWLFLIQGSPLASLDATVVCPYGIGSCVGDVDGWEVFCPNFLLLALKQEINCAVARFTPWKSQLKSLLSNRLQLADNNCLAVFGLWPTYFLKFTQPFSLFMTTVLCAQNNFYYTRQAIMILILHWTHYERWHSSVQTIIWQ